MRRHASTDPARATVQSEKMGVTGRLALRSPRFVVLALSLACLLGLAVYMIEYDSAEESAKSPLEAAAREEKKSHHADHNAIKHANVFTKPNAKIDDVKEKYDRGDGGNDDVKIKKDIQKTEIEKAKQTTPDRIDVYFALTNVHKDRREQFDRFAKSLLKHTRSRLRFHALVDSTGRDAVTGSVPEGPSIKILFYDINDVAKRAEPFVKPLKDHFVGSQRSYYSNPIFFVPVVLHRLLGDDVHRLVVLDTDMEFRSDIQILANLFDSFSPNHLMGLAHEQQPVYRHVFHMYRNSHKGTLVGDPPPNGLTGFNSGVVLMHLERMRSSKFYNQAVQGQIVKEMAERYLFQGHLGDQDFYTLLSLERADLFFVLPCTWNRQLCTWWGDHGYKGVMDEYHTCEGNVNLYHGNCNTPIPIDNNA